MHFLPWTPVQSAMIKQEESLNSVFVVCTAEMLEGFKVERGFCFGGKKWLSKESFFSTFEEDTHRSSLKKLRPGEVFGASILFQTSLLYSLYSLHSVNMRFSL